MRVGDGWAHVMGAGGGGRGHGAGVGEEEGGGEGAGAGLAEVEGDDVVPVAAHCQPTAPDAEEEKEAEEAERNLTVAADPLPPPDRSPPTPTSLLFEPTAPGYPPPKQYSLQTQDFCNDDFNRSQSIRAPT